MKTQHGAAMVEFALIALVFFMVLFAIIEFGRAFFTYNTLVEATRRGARVAAVCPASTGGKILVQQVTIFNTPTGISSTTSGFLGLKESDVSVKYFQNDMTELTSPPLAATSGDYNKIAFVQVEITGINNTHKLGLIIPGISVAFPVPSVQTTLPSESLGRTTPNNPTTTRQCCFNGTCIQ